MRLRKILSKDIFCSRSSWRHLHYIDKLTNTIFFWHSSNVFIVLSHKLPRNTKPTHVHQFQQHKTVARSNVNIHNSISQHQHHFKLCKIHLNNISVSATTEQKIYVVIIQLWKKREYIQDRRYSPRPICCRIFLRWYGYTALSIRFEDSKRCTKHSTTQPILNKFLNYIYVLYQCVTLTSIVMIMQIYNNLAISWWMVVPRTYVSLKTGRSAIFIMILCWTMAFQWDSRISFVQRHVPVCGFGTQRSNAEVIVLFLLFCIRFVF